MDKTLAQAAQEFNDAEHTLEGFKAEVVEEGIIVSYFGYEGPTFETVEGFETWAYEGGDSV